MDNDKAHHNYDGCGTSKYSHFFIQGQIPSDVFLYGPQDYLRHPGRMMHDLIIYQNEEGMQKIGFESGMKVRESAGSENSSVVCKSLYDSHLGVRVVPDYLE